MKHVNLPTLGAWSRHWIEMAFVISEKENPVAATLIAQQSEQVVPDVGQIAFPSRRSEQTRKTGQNGSLTFSSTNSPVQQSREGDD
jgi:hypothetical protein